MHTIYRELVSDLTGKGSVPRDCLSFLFLRRHRKLCGSLFEAVVFVVVQSNSPEEYIEISVPNKPLSDMVDTQHKSQLALGCFFAWPCPQSGHTLGRNRGHVRPRGTHQGHTAILEQENEYLSEVYWCVWVRAGTNRFFSFMLGKTQFSPTMSFLPESTLPSHRTLHFWLFWSPTTWIVSPITASKSQIPAGCPTI